LVARVRTKETRRICLGGGIEWRNSAFQVCTQNWGEGEKLFFFRTSEAQTERGEILELERGKHLLRVYSGQRERENERERERERNLFILFLIFIKL
jgi:hypothetical protein